jgi:hypothetical protein
MTPAAILDALAADGIAVRADGDSLKFTGKTSRMTSEMLAVLRERKTAVLNLVRQLEAAATIKQAISADVLPASPYVLGRDAEGLEWWTADLADFCRRTLWPPEPTGETPQEIAQRFEFGRRAAEHFLAIGQANANEVEPSE